MNLHVPIGVCTTLGFWLLSFALSLSCSTPDSGAGGFLAWSAVASAPKSIQEETRNQIYLLAFEYVHAYSLFDGHCESYKSEIQQACYVRDTSHITEKVVTICGHLIVTELTERYTDEKPMLEIIHVPVGRLASLGFWQLLDALDWSTKGSGAALPRSSSSAISAPKKYTECTQRQIYLLMSESTCMWFIQRPLRVILWKYNTITILSQVNSIHITNNIEA